MSRAVLVALCLAAAMPLSAQYPPLPPLGQSWFPISFPKVFYAGRDGVVFGFYSGQILPLTVDDFYAPPPYRAALTLDAEIATSGTKRLRLDARLPRAADGWRFVVTLAGDRRAREPYFGIGNASVFDRGNETGAPDFYRSDRVRLWARGEVQRRIVGPLRVLAGFHAERWKIDTLPGASQLARDLASGVDPTIGRFTGDVSVRVGLVVDTRDDEAAATRGVRLEGIISLADSTVAGELSYTRTTLSGAGYLPLGDRVVLAGRVAAQTMSGNPRIGTLYLMEASDEPYNGLGGSRSHRGLRTNRLLGADKLLANFDVRYTVYHVPTILRVSAVSFFDAGRVFEPEGLRLTSDEMLVGAGGGLFVHAFRNAILGITVGGGSEGVLVRFHSEWTY